MRLIINPGCAQLRIILYHYSLRVLQYLRVRFPLLALVNGKAIFNLFLVERHN